MCEKKLVHCPDCGYHRAGQTVCDGKPTPHKHAALIKAWADGATIEFKVKTPSGDTWIEDAYPTWSLLCEYRIKSEVRPDRNYYGIAGLGSVGIPYVDHLRGTNGNPNNNIELTFDGATGKLKSVQLI